MSSQQRLKTIWYETSYYDGCPRMTLLKNIKFTREKQRAKQPFRHNVFNRISGIVRHYCLDESFLGFLEDAEKHQANDDLKPVQIRTKKPMVAVLFSLVTEREYALTTSIMRQIDNPYLQFAHSPEEILLCKQLYRLNPSIPTERLERFHFGSLILYERNKTGTPTIETG